MLIIHEIPSLIITDGDKYCCYFCQHRSARIERVLEHTLSHHKNEEQFSAKIRQLDEQSGRSAYIDQSIMMCCLRT